MSSQPSLLDWHPPAPETREQIKRAVCGVLHVYARGRAAAITGERLTELVAERLASEGTVSGMTAKTMQRRCQEAVAELIEAGEPIASRSTPPLGYCVAETAEELMESLGEVERRARMMLRKRRFLRRAMARLQGQIDMRGMA